jgi:hypothetical protein
MTPLRSVRSTVLIGSISGLKLTGYFEPYLAALDPKHTATLVDAIAGTWVPVDAALAHYEACDALGIPVDVQITNGGRTYARAGETLFGTIVKMAKAAGATPWSFLPHMQRFYDRSYQGGA